ncbi:unnamed protein product [Soboliphyme baturini]|uniref:Bromo domain-containing protein n=1 Tax=Soboliphyme baturini TaxID=241478 RepID=A0A183J4W8_9BILA|nr:unnamed protein product [Soboliphyme baturini]
MKSNQQVREGSALKKYARGSLYFTVDEVKKRYREDCQHIFELQNRVLSSREVISTDEESEIDDSDIEQFQKELEELLASDKTMHERKDNGDHFSDEAEELEELRKMVHGETNSMQKEMPPNKSHGSHEDGEDLRGKTLKIYRTYRRDDGTEYESTECVTSLPVIQAYLKIRKQKDETFIRNYAQMDNRFLVEQRRQDRRDRARLRRHNKMQFSLKLGLPIERCHKKKQWKPSSRYVSRPDSRPVHCSACGARGHIMVNKNCPLYKTTKMLLKESVREKRKFASTPRNPVSAERMEVPLRKLKKPVVPIHNPVKLSTLKSKAMTGDSGSMSHRKSFLDKGKGHKNGSYRQGANSKALISKVFEAILDKVKNMPQAKNFLSFTGKENMPGCYEIVKNPMDLQKIHMNVKNNHYVTREEFLKDVKQILDNCRLYSGDQSSLTYDAKKVFEFTCRLITEKEHEIMLLEKAINPLLDENDQVVFNFILERIVDSCKSILRSLVFHKPSELTGKTYYDKVTCLADLDTMKQKCRQRKYCSIDEFVKDAEWICINSRNLHGPSSPFTQKSSEIVAMAKKLVTEVFVFIDFWVACVRRLPFFSRICVFLLMLLKMSKKCV